MDARPVRGGRASHPKGADGLAISVVTLAELYEGIESTRDPGAARLVLDDFLKLVTVIPFSEKVAARFGTESARLRRLGQPLPDFDLVIAATAMQYGLTLLTEDRHFEQIPSLVIQSLYGAGR